MAGRFAKLCIIKVKVVFYIAQYPVSWTAQSALHFLQVQRSEFTQPRVRCQLSELWAERRDGQSHQMTQTCVSGSAPEFVIDMIHG